MLNGNARPPGRLLPRLAGKTRCGVLAWIVAVFSLFLAACDSDRTAKVVDFRQTVHVDRPDTRTTGQAPLRIAVAAMISPKETFIHYQELLDYLGRKLGRPVQLVQRKTYAEINEMLSKGAIDLAFLCSGPYALDKDRYGFELVATPEAHGSHFYESYLIVNAKSPVSTLEELRGKTFAFTDPDSNTGRIVPLHWLSQVNERPDTFFKQTIFTYSHDNSIEAVARGLVDGAAVDGLVWQYVRARDPELTERTKVIRKSDPYGIPPLVSTKGLSKDVKEAVRKNLFQMHEDPEGRKILDQLMIDRFVEPDDRWYDSIRAMLNSGQSVQAPPDVPQKP
jgi:phosphonate transport system substrate-binding protein